MSDRFDPEAWPYPDDDEPTGPGNSQKIREDADDDYQSLDFDKPAAAPAEPTFGDPYFDAPYSDAPYSDAAHADAPYSDAAHADAPYSDTGVEDFGYGPVPGADQGGYDYGDPPSPGYGQPSEGYGVPASSYDDEDFSTIPTTPAVGDREPYGPADQGFGYEDDDFGTAANSHRSSGSYDDDDPYGSQDLGYEDDDDEDFDDGYAREPEQTSGGVGRKILGFLVILVLLAAAVIASLTLFGGGGDQATTPTTAVTEPGSATTAPPTTATGQQTVTVGNAPDEVITALNNALTAWGQFAVTGDLTTVQPHFAANGEQYKRLESDAEALRASPPGGAPLSMTIVIPDKSMGSVDADNWIIRGTVTVAREGSPTQNNKWEFRMVRIDNKWQVATVRNYQD